MLQDAYKRAKTLLQNNEKDLHKLAKALLEQETLNATEIKKALEDENAKLKRLLADQMLDNVVLKDLLGKS